LFVPNLFLGLDYVKLKRFNEAIPYLKRAALSKPTDIQAQAGLGQAYRGSGKTRLASAAYLRAVQIDPKNADGWFYVGVSYLEQVEADARVLLAQHKDSGYTQALVAETFSEQRAFIQAADAYKKTLTLPTFPPGMHAGYGFALLNRHDFTGAERELRSELASNPGSLFARLGLARLQVEQGTTEQGVKEIEEIWKSDPGFLKANLRLLNSGLPTEKRDGLLRILEERQAAGDISQEVAELFRNGAADEGTTDFSQQPGRAAGNAAGRSKAPVGNAAELYAKGKYRVCSNLLASRSQLLSAKDL